MEMFVFWFMVGVAVGAVAMSAITWALIVWLDARDHERSIKEFGKRLEERNANGCRRFIPPRGRSVIPPQEEA